MAIDYDEACKRAATDQGLDPVVAYLSEQRLPVTIEQTGGFCMVAAVYSESGNYAWISASETESDTYLLGIYDRDGEDVGIENLVRDASGSYELQLEALPALIRGGLAARDAATR